MNGIVAYGSLAGEHWYAPPLREIVNPYYFQDNERLPQYRTEQVLRARMAELANVESAFGWSAETVEQDDDGARVAIIEDGNGRSDDPGGRLCGGLRRQPVRCPQADRH